MKDAVDRPQTKEERNQEIASHLGGLSASHLEEQLATSESVRTVRFLFHVWGPRPINNRSGAGNRFGARHSSFPRMSLIPVWAWTVPVILPRSTPFVLGQPFATGASAGAAVGSRFEERLQLASQSVEMLLGAYGKHSLVELTSLAAEADEAKLESLLLFEAVMNTPMGKDGPAGSDLLLEDLLAAPQLKAPKSGFLDDDAKEMLLRALTDGVPFKGQVEKFSNRGRAKLRGEQMIEDVKRSVVAAHRLALNEQGGILVETKKQLIGAAARMPDNKAQMDGQDIWLSQQYPSFSFDTTVELASRAGRETADAIRESSSENNLILQQLFEQNKLQAEQNKLLMELVRKQQG